MRKITIVQVLNCSELNIREVALLLKFLENNVFTTRVEALYLQLEKLLKLIPKTQKLNNKKILIKNEGSKFLKPNLKKPIKKGRLSLPF